MKKLIYTLLTCLIVFSCEDVVNIKLTSADPMLNVDAWITHTSDTQKITLNYSQPYFDNSDYTPALNATVAISEEGTGVVYNFEDADNDGIYTWVSPVGEAFGTIGLGYQLDIELEDGSSYQSSSFLDSVPPIDSITFEYNPADAFIDTVYHYAEFWSRDLEGTGDTYWIKTYKNGVFLSDAEFINLAYDAGFSAGGEVDNLIFIQPIRTLMNDFEDENDDFVSPYTFGDSVRVEIHAINEDAWFFLTRVLDEANPAEGFGQLFEDPMGNVSTNIEPMGNSAEALGFFNVASVSSLEVEMTEQLVVDRVKD